MLQILLLNDILNIINIIECVQIIFNGLSTNFYYLIIIFLCIYIMGLVSVELQYPFFFSITLKFG